MIYLKPEKQKIEMGDKVRISKYKRQVFDKGHSPKLQKAKQQTFRIAKVLKLDNKKKMASVKWSGYYDKFNSWINFKDLVNF